MNKKLGKRNTAIVNSVEAFRCTCPTNCSCPCTTMCGNSGVFAATSSSIHSGAAQVGVTPVPQAQAQW